MKPREWWICQTPGYDGDAYDTDPRTWSHKDYPMAGKREPTNVIEKSAYDSLEAKLKIATEALEFYAIMRHPVYQDTARLALQAIHANVDNVCSNDDGKCG